MDLVETRLECLKIAALVCHRGGSTSASTNYGYAGSGQQQVPISSSEYSSPVAVQEVLTYANALYIWIFKGEEEALLLLAELMSIPK